MNHQRTPTGTSKNTRCSACNQEGHRRNNKKCPSNRQQTPTGTSTNTRRSACDQEGHRRNSKKCPSTSNQQIPTRNPKWKDSEAEKELRKMLENDHNGHYHALSSEQVRNHRESFRVYDRTKFQDYLKKLKEKIAKKKRWGGAARNLAKSVLENDPQGVYHEMDAKTFWQLSPLFQKYPFENFKGNLKTMKDRIANSKMHVNNDKAWLRHDRSVILPKMVTSRGYPRWDRHNARRLLKQDVIAKRNETMKPQELWRSRNEYQAFPLSVFRKHIYQEVYGQNSSSYWLNRKTKDDDAKKAEQALKEKFLQGMR